MTRIAAPTRWTPEEVDRLSHRTGKHYELVAGALVEKPSIGARANWMVSQIVFRLGSAYRPPQAYVFVHQPTYCFGRPDHMRKPEVALVWGERMPEGPGKRELEIAPDLVVEVVSPSTIFTEQFGRVAEYLGAGVPVVWVADPERRWLFDLRRNGSVIWRRASDTIEDDPDLPGLSLAVADLFPDVPALAGSDGSTV